MVEQTAVAPPSFYDKIYQSRKPSQHEWVAGTASPELINLVWNQVLVPGMKFGRCFLS